MEDYKVYFTNKIAAIAGGASGVGLALAEEMLVYGAAKVVLADYNRENLAKHEVRLNGLYPGKVKGIFCDVTKEDNVQDMISQASSFFGGRLDLLFNCAGSGFMGRFADAGDIDPEDAIQYNLQVADNKDWEKAFALNFYGSLYGCRAAIPIMLKQGSGQIINIISGIAFSPMPYQAMYAATKAALHALTLSLRAEFWEHNIRFNSATPGTTITAIWGDKSPPAFAQTAQQSAQRVLKGVAHNDRIICGDDSDLDSSKHCFSPEYQEGIDQYMIEATLVRKSGKGFLPDP